MGWKKGEERETWARQWIHWAWTLYLLVLKWLDKMLNVQLPSYVSVGVGRTPIWERSMGIEVSARETDKIWRGGKGSSVNPPALSLLVTRRHWNLSPRLSQSEAPARTSFASRRRASHSHVKLRRLSLRTPSSPHWLFRFFSLTPYFLLSCGQPYRNPWRQSQNIKSRR